MTLYILSRKVKRQLVGVVFKFRGIMFCNRKTLTVIFFVFIFSLLFVGNASGKILFNDTIQQGDGYQINNIVIDVTEVFTGQEAATLRIYKGEDNDYIYDPFLSIDSSYKFDIEGEEVGITLLNVYSGVVPRVKLLITVTDDDFINSKTLGVINGGHNEAVFSGTPVLTINKVVDRNDIDVGDVIRVTVTVENRGDDDAIDVVFSEPQQEKFVLIDDILGSPGRIKVSVDDPVKKIYVYDLKATESGTFSLKPTTATFTNSVGDSFPQASSNRPSVIVDATEDLVNATLDVNTEFDKYTANRKETLSGTVRIKNTGTAAASAVTIKLIVPDGLEYAGSDASVEMISGIPTIYLDSFGVQQEKEIDFELKATEVGTYTVSTETSYLFNDGVNAQDQQVTSSSVTNKIYVTKGKYDYLFEQPLYVYIIPLIIIGAIAGWIIYRHKQYKF